MTNSVSLFDGTDGVAVDNTNAATYGLALVNASGGTIKLSASAAVHGPTGLSITGPNPGSYCMARKEPVAADQKMGVSVCFGFPALPPSNVSFAALANDSSQSHWTASIANDGKFRINIAGTSLHNGGDTVLAAGQMYRLQIGSDSAAGEVHWELFDATGSTALGSGDGTGLSFTAGTSTATRCEIGTLQSTAGFVVRVDDWQMDNGTITPPPPVTAEAASTVRPNSVVDADDWSAHNASDLAVALADNDDTTYAESPAAASNDAFTVAFPVLDDGVVTVKTRADKDSADATGSLKVELLQTDTVIASQTFTVTDTAADYQFTTTEAEAGNITDRSALRVRHTATIS